MLDYLDELMAEREVNRNLLKELSRRNPMSHYLKLHNGKIVLVDQFDEVSREDFAKVVAEQEQELAKLKELQERPETEESRAPEAVPQNPPQPAVAAPAQPIAPVDPVAAAAGLSQPTPAPQPSAPVMPAPVQLQ